MKTCYLYPGQGSQYPEMGKDLWGKYNCVKELFTLASDMMSIDCCRLLFESDSAVLGRTDNTQPAVTLVNLAVRRALEENGYSSDGCAGHSLGEWAAYADAGVLSEADVLKSVALRGRLMHAAGEKAAGAGADSSMAAVIGLDRKTVADGIENIDGAYLANLNAPSQIVISGTQKGLELAEESLKKAGARRVIRLKVSAPCHSPLLEEARAEFSTFLNGLEFSDPVKMLFSNVTGKAAGTGAEARKLALKQIVSPVLWVDEEKSIIEAGFERCLETGPGKVLSGLWKSVSSDIECIACGTSEQIDALGA